MKYIVGAYVTSPCLFEWDESQATNYMEGIKKISNVKGLEHPFWGSLHPFDESWFLNNIDPSWDFVLTCIPGTMVELSKNPNFGLASDSKNGRAAAIEYIEEARKAVVKLNSFLARSAVMAVQVHSAPNSSIHNVFSSKSAFYQSLSELQTWDWDGAKIVIEHCDASNGNYTPEKGFLPLIDEISVVEHVNRKSKGKPIGICINWGRSVIEKQHVPGALEHINQVRKSGLLSGLIFSGCSNKKSPYGIWKDTHMPPPKEFNNRYYAKDSLMNASNIRNCILASDYTSLNYLGIKIMALPNNADINTRLGLNRDALRLLDQIITNI